MDFHGPIRVGEAVQYTSPRLAHGSHTLRVRVTGERNAQSRAAFVSIDRAEVYVN
ncbi:hypothetical protein GCM10010297_21410 [Streptomyces malachitofuscus]|nr:hypothetical protein GCM10010297_21410 [Streptomyces malachitofuscus]